MTSSRQNQSPDKIELQNRALAGDHSAQQKEMTDEPQSGARDVPQEVPEHSAANLSAGSDSAEIYRDDQTQAVLIPASPDEPSRSPGLLALASAAIIILLSGGLATLLFIWLYTHRINQPPQTWRTVWHNGGLVVDEGTETVEGLQHAKTVGLTISSATSHIISSTGSVICGVFAYNIADRFLRLSTLARQGKPSHLLPTPLQFALLLGLCYAGTLGALGALLFYLSRGSSRRAKASPLVIHAAALAGLAYILIHGVGLADFFFHKGTTTTELTRQGSLPATSFGRVFNATGCGLGADSTPLDGTKPNALNSSTGGFQGCNMGLFRWGDTAVDDTVFLKGLDALSNTSAFGQAVLVSQGTSVVTPPNADVHQSFLASSISVSVECRVISDHCRTDNKTTSAGSCDPPDNLSFTTLNALANLPAYDAGGGLSNPITFAYIFGVQTIDPPPSAADYLYAWLKPNGDMEMMVAACTAEISNVSLHWTNGSYSVGNPVPASSFIAGSIFSPTWQTMQSTLLTSQIGVLAYTVPTVAELQDGLGNIFATGILQRSMGLVMPTNTTSISSVSTGIVTQYPIIPLLCLLALLYVYALLALFVTVGAMTARAPPLLLRGPSGNTTSISTLALAQRSVVNPLGIVAAFLAHDGEEATRARASASDNNQEIFAASECAPQGPVRVVVGLGGSRAQPSFGVWRLENGEEEKEELLALSRETSPDRSFDPQNLYATEGSLARP